MKSRSKEMLERSIAAMLAAIEIHNKPDFKYRLESFTILAINAWELLLKAKWLKDNNNNVSSLYVRIGKSTKHKRIKRSRSGTPLTFEIMFLVKKLREQGELDELASRNIEGLVELRDSVIHFYKPRSVLEQRIHELGAASVLNFVNAIYSWFDFSLEKYSFFLLPISFIPPQEAKAIRLSSNERNFLTYLHSLDASVQTDTSDGYMVTLKVNVQFERGRTDDAVLTRLSNDPNALPVRLTYEQIRQKYPWTYQELSDRLRKRYSDFKMNQRYHRIRRSLEDDDRYCRVRFLDPANPNSLKKKFYNPNILQEFDRYYTRK